MYNDITVDQLRAAGSVKWTTFPDALGMFIAEMDFGTPPVVARMITENVDRLGYLPQHVKDDLKDEVARRQQRLYQWSFDPAQVSIMPDVLSGLRYTIRMTTGPIVVPTPAYMPFLTMVTDRRLVQVPSPVIDGKYVLDIDRIRDELAGGGLLILCNPWNPAGRVLTRRELAEVETVVSETGSYVFSDEIHADLVFDGQHVPYASTSPAAADHTVTAVSASKSWNIPGLKCGQIIIPPSLASSFAPFALEASDPTGILGAKAALTLYRDDEGWLDHIKPILKSNRDKVSTFFDSRGFFATKPEGTYISWIDASPISNTPCDCLRRSGLAVTAGGASGAGFENFVRMVFASPSHIVDSALECFDRALTQ